MKRKDAIFFKLHPGCNQLPYDPRCGHIPFRTFSDYTGGR